MDTTADIARTVHSHGICHGLPDLTHARHGLNAIVVGASGMSGQSMINRLVEAPERWTNIHCVSRRPPQTGNATTTVNHVPIDLLNESSEIAATLVKHNVQADVVFFFGYVQLSAEERKYSAANKESAQKLADINGRLLQTFLEALKIASIAPKRILLQTGLKNYHCHQGPANVPFDERDPRIELGPNFYFTQEDILFDYCKSNPATTYNVTMPSWILGDVAASDMTTIYPLAIFAVVQRKLGRPFAFPGDTPAWEKVMPMSSAVLNSYFHEWLVLEDSTARERFNIVDDSEFTWMGAWPVIAQWLNMPWKPPAEEDKDLYETVVMPSRPRGYGPKGCCRSSFSLTQWAKQAETHSAWAELQRDHGLEADPFAGADGMFSALQFSLTMSWSWATKMDKARKFGWHGHIDSLESIHQVMTSLANRKMLPPL